MSRVEYIFASMTFAMAGDAIPIDGRRAAEPLSSIWVHRPSPAMTCARFLFVVVVTIFAQIAEAQDYGRYIGVVRTEWLEGSRQMRLLAPFAYVDTKGQEWRAPAGWIVDGASIPQFAWSFIGGPFEGNYRNASVIHDVACDEKTRPWEAVHEVFYWAMLASGVESWRAKVMYGAVYHFGPRWPRQVIVRGIPSTQTAVARQKATEKAEPGSSAKILGVRPYGSRSGAREAEFTIQVRPPVNRLSEADFEKLKQDIKSRESSASGALTLNDIRTFQP